MYKRISFVVDWRLWEFVPGKPEGTELLLVCRLIAHERGLSFSERRFVAIKRDHRSPPIDIL
jgi:hypothetical protein